jgi:hypothetical protein
MSPLNRLLLRSFLARSGSLFGRESVEYMRSGTLRKERSALRTVRPCRPKESKDVLETMKKLERDIRKQEPR